MEKKKKSATTSAKVVALRKAVVSPTGLNSTQTSGVRLGRDLTLLGAHSRGGQ